MPSFRSALLALAATIAAIAPALATDRPARQPSPAADIQSAGLFGSDFDGPIRPSSTEILSSAEIEMPSSAENDEEPSQEKQSTAQPLLPKPILLTSASSSAIADEAYDDSIVIAEDEADDPNATRFFETTWYARVDYFQWQEIQNGNRYLRNEGASPTFGWQRRHGQQRYRFDLFAARADNYVTIKGQAFENLADYFGLRGEYELLWEPQNLPHSWFAGIGTRYFIRSFSDVTASDRVYFGYHQAWWTFYPYLGLETRRTLSPNWQFFCMARVGLTAFTRERVSFDDFTLFPRPNLTYQSELGLRGPQYSLSIFAEYMGWSESPQVLKYADGQVHHLRQPEALLLTLGGRVTWSY